MTAAPSILIVDDEPDLVATLAYNLEREGYRIVSASTGREALAKMKQEQPCDLVLLDLMLPDLSGTEVCRQLRTQPHTRDVPVIMITAKGDEIDRVVGFELGVDDYVVKPFSVRELMLRIRAVLRRAQPPAPASLPSGVDTIAASIAFGCLKLDPDAHQVWVEDQEVKLTALEFKLLSLLHKRKGRVQTRDMLLSDVWGIDAEITTRTVDTHVKRLREKLGSAGHYVETLRGVGYRFCATPQEASA